MKRTMIIIPNGDKVDVYCDRYLNGIKVSRKAYRDISASSKLRISRLTYLQKYFVRFIFTNNVALFIGEDMAWV